MEWLFGSKKSNKPEVFIAKEVEDGFNVVSYRTQSYPGTSNPQYPPNWSGQPWPGNQQGTPYSLSGPFHPLYPPLTPQYPGQPYIAVCPQAPPGHVPHQEYRHPLDSIPFKLASPLEDSTTIRRTLEDLEGIRKRLDNLAKMVKSSELSYTFDLERSVLREPSAYN